MIAGAMPWAKSTLPVRSPCTICSRARLGVLKEASCSANGARDGCMTRGAWSSQAARSPSTQMFRLASRKSGRGTSRKALCSASPAARTSPHRAARSWWPSTRLHADQPATAQRPARDRTGRLSRNPCSGRSRRVAPTHSASATSPTGFNTTSPATHVLPCPPSRRCRRTRSAPNSASTWESGRDSTRGSCPSRVAPPSGWRCSPAPRSAFRTRPSEAGTGPLATSALPVGSLQRTRSTTNTA